MIMTTDDANSDVSSVTASHSDANPGSTMASNPTPRRIALSIVFVLLLAALIYDYGVARPSVNQAYDAILTQFQDANLSASSLTRSEIESIVNRPAVESFEDNGQTVDVYQWASGLPLKNHNLYVVYRTVGEDDVFVRHFKYSFDPSDRMQARTADDLIADRAEKSGREGAETSLRRATNASAMAAAKSDDKSSSATEIPSDALPKFAELDTNEDGILERSEWPESFQDQLESLDVNGDGQIDPTEFAAAVDEGDTASP